MRVGNKQRELIAHHPHCADEISFASAFAGLVQRSEDFLLQFLILLVETWENTDNESWNARNQLLLQWEVVFLIELQYQRFDLAAFVKLEPHRVGLPGTKRIGRKGRYQLSRFQDPETS